MTETNRQWIPIKFILLQDDELCARGNFQAEVTSTVEEIFTDLTSLLSSVGGAEWAREADGLQQRLQGMFRQVNSGLNTEGFTLPCGAFRNHTETKDGKATKSTQIIFETFPNLTIHSKHLVVLITQ